MNHHYKTATVFGGTGFIGNQVVRTLAKAGFIVKIACRLPDRAYDLRPCGVVGQIVPLFCDFKDQASIEAAVRGSDCVVNCIGILNRRGRATFQKIHVDLPRMIAEACKRQGISRFVHISALGAVQGASKYAVSKRAGEQAVRDAFPQTTILRPSVVFGPDDDFFNKFAALERYLPFMPLIGGGRTRLQPVYAGDVAEAALAALTLPDSIPGSPCGQTYELGGPEAVDFRAIYKMIFKYTGRRRLMLPVPWVVAKLQGCFLGLLPNPVLTMDQVESLKTDNIVSPNALTLNDLGVTPTDMELVLPDYLGKFRAGGKFGLQQKAI